MESSFINKRLDELGNGIALKPIWIMSERSVFLVFSFGTSSMIFESLSILNSH